MMMMMMVLSVVCLCPVLSYHLSEDTPPLLIVSGNHTESIPYHLRGIDRGQIEVMERDEEAF